MINTYNSFFVSQFLGNQTSGNKQSIKFAWAIFKFTQNKP